MCTNFELPFDYFCFRYTLFNMLTGKISAFELDEIVSGWGRVFYIVYMFSQIYCFLNYVFGIFNYAMLVSFYGAKEENYFGFHVREYVRVRAIVLSARLQWMKFWERGASGKKQLTEAQLMKKKKDLELRLEPWEIFITDSEIFSTKVELRHLRLLLGQAAVTQAVQDVDKFGTCQFDKPQIKDILELVSSKVKSEDKLSYIKDVELEEWPLRVNPRVFGKLDVLQRDSRSTRFKEKFFREMEGDLMKTKNTAGYQLATVELEMDK